MKRLTEPTVIDNNDRYARIWESVIDKAPQIGASAFTVYGILSWIAGSKQDCYPSNATIQRMTGLSERTVAKAIDTLIEHGFITRMHRLAKDGGKLSNNYTINRVPATHPSVKITPSPPAESTHKLDASITNTPSEYTPAKNNDDSPSLTSRNDSRKTDDASDRDSFHNPHARDSAFSAPADTRPYDLVSWWMKKVGLAGRPDMKQYAAAKKLIAMGVTKPEELHPIFTWLMQDPWWRDKGVDMTIMASQYAKFKSRGVNVAPKIKDV